jgi:hypothetical protein
MGGVYGNDLVGEGDLDGELGDFVFGCFVLSCVAFCLFLLGCVGLFGI